METLIKAIMNYELRIKHYQGKISHRGHRDKNTFIQKMEGLFFSVCSVPSVAKKVFCFLLLAIIIFLPVRNSIAKSAGWQWIGGTRVQDMIKQGSGLWLIDIRNPQSYEAEHIEGSVNIPSALIRHKKIPVNKTLVIVDDSLGLKVAREAADVLADMGSSKVFVLEGGLVPLKFEGHPVVVKKQMIRGVTAAELQWALSNKVSLNLFDMREAAEREKVKINGSEVLVGNNVREKIEKLRELLRKGESRNLSDRLNKSRTNVLIFSQTVNPEVLTWEALRDTKSDVRYLIGGYETKDRQVKAIGSCKTCP
ncbi:MAG: rhodanese-like domain-containing protein [Deltaproteobacteria bacterium]|nr:rhodanese-like domain-containing protein [Deltaproteobacteria bacterium]